MKRTRSITTKHFQLPLPFGTATTMIYSNELTGDRVELRTPVPLSPIATKKANRNNPTTRAMVKHRKKPARKTRKLSPAAPVKAGKSHK